MYSYDSIIPENVNNLGPDCGYAPGEAARRLALPGREEASAPSGDVLPLSTAHIRPRIKYYVGASLLSTTKGQECQSIGGGKRGKIAGFSRNSRLRLMRLIATIKREAELPCFVTLTYPGEFPSVERAKRDLKVFLQRLSRWFPAAGIIWKLEPQQRGAPHFHMMVWSVSLVELLPWVVQNWYEIAGNGDENHFKFHAGQLPRSEPCVQKVRSWRGVWSYASKYLGKTFEVAEWGSLWTGRFWGTVNKQNIPFAEMREVELPERRIVKVMRFQRRFSGIRYQRYRDNTVTIFCDVDHWIEKLSLYPHI